MFEYIQNALDPQAIIMALGTIGVIGIIFIETGLFFGFFLPGDSLIFTAGFLATQGYVSFPALLVGTFVAAVVGDSVGYAFGRRVGPALFVRENSLFFNKKYVARAQSFYEKHGKKTIILARFVPIVRTFAPILAGVGNMDYPTFLKYNVIGGFIWTWGMLWLGYGFGSIIPNPDRYIIPVVIIVVFVSLIPPLRELWKNRKKEPANLV